MKGKEQVEGKTYVNKRRRRKKRLKEKAIRWLKVEE